MFSIHGIHLFLDRGWNQTLILLRWLLLWTSFFTLPNPYASVNLFITVILFFQLVIIVENSGRRAVIFVNL